MNAIGMGGLLNLMDLDIVTGGTRARGLGRDAGVDAGGAGALIWGHHQAG